MAQKEQKHSKNIITVTGTLCGSINGVAINGTVTGTADRSTGHVTNIYHGIDPAIGSELSQMVLGLTIVCADMAIEMGAAKNLNSMTPMQSMQRLVTFTLPHHSMQCRQTVVWPEPNVAVVIMDYSGDLPSSPKASLPIPDVLSEFQQTGPQTIQQSGTTQAAFDGGSQPLTVDIQYSINGPKISWSTLKSQFLENANNTSLYDEATRKITYNTDVCMREV